MGGREHYRGFCPHDCGRVQGGQEASEALHVPPLGAIRSPTQTRHSLNIASTKKFSSPPASRSLCGVHEESTHAGYNMILWHALSLSPPLARSLALSQPHQLPLLLPKIESKAFLEKLPNVIEYTIEKGQQMTVCGDTHGQFYDLLNIFKLNDAPSVENPYVFNGGFKRPLPLPCPRCLIEASFAHRRESLMPVCACASPRQILWIGGRGVWRSSRAFCYTSDSTPIGAAYSASHPPVIAPRPRRPDSDTVDAGVRSVHLTRGNHETTAMNKVYGFEGEVSFKHTKHVYECFVETFKHLPLAVTLNSDVFICHGGLFSEDGVTIEDIKKVPPHKTTTTHTGSARPSGRTDLFSPLML